MGIFGSKATSDVDSRILNSLTQSQRTEPRTLKEIAKRQRPLLALLQETDEIQFAHLSWRPNTVLAAVTNDLVIGVGWDSNFSKGGVTSFLRSEIGEIEKGVTKDANYWADITSTDALPFKAFRSDTGSAAYQKYYAGKISLQFSERTRLDEFVRAVS